MSRYSEKKKKTEYYESEDDCEKVIKYTCVVLCFPCYCLYFVLKFIWDNCLEKCLTKLFKIIEKIVNFVCKVLEEIFNFVHYYVAKCCKIIFKVFEEIFKVIKKICIALWNVIKPCIMPIIQAIQKCIKLICLGIAACCRWIFKEICVPIFKCISWIFNMIGKCMKIIWKFLDKYVFQPILKGFELCFKYIISPILYVIDYLVLKPIKMVLNFIGKILWSIYDFLDDLWIELCLSGSEKRNEKKRKQEKRLKRQRSREIEKRKTSKKLSRREKSLNYVEKNHMHHDIENQYSSPHGHLKQGNIPNTNIPVNENLYFVCPNCNYKILLKNIETHEQICKPINNQKGNYNY